MQKLWGGRFTKETDALTRKFNDSLPFDARLYKEDIAGSVAHAKMLGKQGILSHEEEEAITAGLQEMLEDIEAGKLVVSGDYEDIHSFMEAKLIEKIGEPGKKLHTGRSRNDQVALDMKLYVRTHMDETDKALLGLQKVIFRLMREHVLTVMPGFTHLQKAQPVTFSHHLGAYFEMLCRDRERIEDAKERLNTCPLGAGALAGTTYPLDRDYTAKLLRFKEPAKNSMDAVSDRDYLLEYLSALSILMMHLSRFSEEIILWNSQEYRFIELDDAFSTGSSIMPQKKNPDIAELVRGKCGRVFGALMQLLTTMKGLPLAYNKDMQEDKECAFDAMDTVKDALVLFAGMLSTIKVNADRMKKSAAGGFTNATDAADYLVKKGVPFRDAHGIVGRLVLLCEEKGLSLEALPLAEYKKVSPVFAEDIYDAIDLLNCVNRRNTKGAPGEAAFEEALAEWERYLEES